MLNEKSNAYAPPAADFSAAMTERSTAPLELDPKDYTEHLSAFDLTEDQERELLQTLWHIMSIFVDIGWGVDTVQIILPELFGEVATESDTGNNEGGHD